MQTQVAPARRRAEIRLGILMVAPALLLVLGVYLYPLILTLVYSVSRVDIATFQVERFVGLGNYAAALRNEAFLGSLGRTLYYAAMVVSLTLGADKYAPWTDLLISTAIHDLDMMIWLNGHPVERVFAECVPGRSAQWGKEDAIMGVLRFANGAIGSVETSWVLPPTMPGGLDASLHVVATGGCLVIEGSNHGLAVANEQRYWHPDLSHWPVLQGKVDGNLRHSVDHFIRAVQYGATVPMTPGEALYVEKVVAAMKDSMRTGRPVYLAN